VSKKTSLTMIMPTSDKDWCADVTNYPGAVLVFFGRRLVRSLQATEGCG